MVTSSQALIILEYHSKRKSYSLVAVFNSLGSLARPFPSPSAKLLFQDGSSGFSACTLYGTSEVHAFTSCYIYMPMYAVAPLINLWHLILRIDKPTSKSPVCSLQFRELFILGERYFNIHFANQMCTRRNLCNTSFHIYLALHVFLIRVYLD